MKTSGWILLTMLAALLFGPGVTGSVEAATACKELTSASLEREPWIGPLAKARQHASMHIQITSGSGSVGSYTIQESNTYNMNNSGWIANGTAVTTAGMTKKTDVEAQFVRVKINALPAASTTVVVCLYVDGPGE